MQIENWIVIHTLFYMTDTTIQLISFRKHLQIVHKFKPLKFDLEIGKKLGHISTYIWY